MIKNFDDFNYMEINIIDNIKDLNTSNNIIDINWKENSFNKKLKKFTQNNNLNPFEGVLASIILLSSSVILSCEMIPSRAEFFLIEL